jgi:hypothetical protein
MPRVILAQRSTGWKLPIPEQDCLTAAIHPKRRSIAIRPLSKPNPPKQTRPDSRSFPYLRFFPLVTFVDGFAGPREIEGGFRP